MTTLGPSTKRRKTDSSGKGLKQTKTKPEKRVDAAGKTVIYRAHASQQVKERIQRALPGSGHRMFVIERSTAAPVGSGGPKEEFAVLGATGNVYRVSIGMHPSCSCPDFRKGNVCKHVLFVMVRVIRLAPDDPLIWQKALLRSEAEAVLSGQRSTRAADVEVSASDTVRDQWRRTQSGSIAAVEPEPNSGQRDLTEAECPICYDDFSEQEDVVWCKACGNSIHRSCFANWAKAKTAARAEVTCVYCRAVWDMDSKVRSGNDSEGYVNLRQYSDAHAGADVSLDSLYGDTAVWIRNGGRNRARNAALYGVSRGAL